jgi:peptide methionine sulfoxide reductase MsrA
MRSTRGRSIPNSLKLEAALASREAYEASLRGVGRSKITTEIAPAPEFYFAEEDHQQYLANNPYGYCNLRGTGVACAMPNQHRHRPDQPLLPVCRGPFPNGQDSA